MHRWMILAVMLVGCDPADVTDPASLETLPGENACADLTWELCTTLMCECEEGPCDTAAIFECARGRDGAPPRYSCTAPDLVSIEEYEECYRRALTVNCAPIAPERLDPKFFNDCDLIAFEP